MGDFVCRNSEFAISFGSLQGDLSTLTFYEGTITNEQDLSIFPFDTDTVVLNFWGNQCYKKNGEVNVSYKTDYRLLFDADSWMADNGPSVAPFGWELVSTFVEPVGKEEPNDIIQIKLNMKRHTSFYLFKVAIPLILITCLNFMGFNLETLEARLANNVSLFLAAQALLYVVGSELPRGAFLTAIDRIVFVTLMLLFGTSIHFVILWRLDKMAGIDLEIEDLQNVEKSSNVSLKISQAQASKDKIESNEMIVLTYVSIYFAYLIVESFQLMIRRMWSCSHFKKNIGQKREFADGVWRVENFWLNGVSEFNAAVEADPSFGIPHWLIVDPFTIALVRKGDPRTLLLPALEVNVPTKLILPTGKAVVMSSKPASEYLGKEVKWMTIGSPARALEVVLGTDNCIKVYTHRIRIPLSIC